MEPCPTNKHGRHEINAVLPESSELPVILFCAHCGQTKTVSFSSIPLDDYPADAIAVLVKEQR